MYTWTPPSAPGLTGGTGESVSQIAVTGILHNNTSSVLTATYAVSTSTGRNYTLHVLVTPLPVADPVDDQDPVCTMDATPIINVSGPKPNTVFFWTYQSPEPFIGIPRDGGPVANFIQTFVAENNTNVLRTATISVIPSINGCVGLPVTFRMPVKPAPNVTDIPNRNLCHGVTSTQINLTSNMPGSLITWNSNNTSIGIPANGVGVISSFTVTNLTQVPVTARIEVQGFSNGCDGNAEAFEILVNPLPEILPVSNISICGGLSPTVTFSAPSYPGTIFNWTNSDISNGLPANGTGQISSFIANNFSNLPVSSLFTVTPSFFGCPGTPISFTMEVKATPRVDPIGNISRCNNTLIGPIIFSGSPIAGTEFQWQHNVPGIGLATLTGIGNIDAFTATSSNIPVISNFTVRPFSNTCFGPAINFSVRVNPTPTVNQIADQINCEFLNATAVVFSGNVGGTIFNWTNNRSDIGLPAVGSGNIPAFTYVNPSTTDIIATITVTPLSNTCSGSPITYSYTVRAAPDMVQPLSQTKCNGTLTDQVIFSSSTMPGATFSWTRTPLFVGSLPLSGTGNFDAFTAVNLSSAPIQTAITVTPFSNNCNGPSRTFNLVINPTPSVTVVPAGPIMVCSGFSTSVTFSGSNVNNTIYQWSNSNNLIGLGNSGTGSIAPFITTNSGSSPLAANITVTPISNTCQGTPVAFSIIVRPTPTLNPLSDITVCSGSSVNAITFTGSIVTGTQYNWSHTMSDVGLASPSGTGDIPAFSATNTYNVPISSLFMVVPFSNGCSGTSRSFTLRVNPTPTIAPISDRVVCTGSPINQTFGGSSVANTTFNWTNTNTSIGIVGSGTGSALSFTAANSSNIPISGLVTVTPVSNTCFGIPTQFSIQVNPVVGLDPIPDQVVCSGVQISSIIFSGSNVNNTIYSWTNSNPAIGLASTSGNGNIPAFTSTTPSNVPIVSFFTVTAMSNTCNSITRSFSIVVNPVPTVTTTTNAVYCSGQPINLNFSGSAVPGTLYQWTNTRTEIGLAANGSTSNNTFTATNNSNIPITAQITVTPVSNSCQGTPNTFSITVNPIPTVQQVADLNLCHTQTSNKIFFGGSPVSGTQYNWTRTSVPVGSLSVNGTDTVTSFTGWNLGNVSLTSVFIVTPISNACAGASMTFSITVNPIPQLDSIPSLNLCGGVATGNIIFSDPTLTGTQFEWTNSNPFIGLPASGMGAINSFTVTNNFLSPITASISVLPVFNTCYGTGRSFSIVIKPTPTVNQENSQSVCIGTVIPTITFTGSALSSTDYNWSNSNSGTGLVNTSGTASIAGFTSTNLSNIPLSSLITVVPYTNGCSGSPMQFTIQVNPIPSVNPVADITICGTQTILPINFVGTTANGNVIVPGTVFNWTNTSSDIGLPLSGSGSIPAFSATNLYNIPITGLITVTPVSNSCSGTPISFSINIRPSPTVTPVPSQALCTNLSTDPIILTGSTIPNTVYNWTHSNTGVGLASTTGTGSIPSFSATNSSNGPISTIITVIPFSNACSGTPYPIVITVNPIPAVDPVSSFEVCGNTLIGPVNFSGSPLAGTQYQWTNDNSNIGLPTSGIGSIAAFTVSNSNNVPVVANFQVTPLSNTCFGLPVSFSILVKPSPKVDAVVDQALCTNLITSPILFGGSTVSGTEYRWTQTNTAVGLAAVTGTGNIASFTAANLSNIPITSIFTVRGFSNTCFGTPVQFSVTVNPIPAVYQQTDILVCGNQTTGPVIFTGSPLFGTVYQWNNTNTSIGLPASGSGNITAFTAANNFNTLITAQITVTPFSNGCSGVPMQFGITVRPTPSVDGIADRVFCTQAISSPINFAGSTIPNSIYQWTHNNIAVGLGSLSGVGTIPAFTTTNLSNTRITSQFVITPFSNGCSGEPALFQIIVDPIPRLDPINDVVVCGLRSTDPIIFTGSPIAGTVFNWTNNNIGIGLAASGSGNITSFSASNNSTAPISSLITVTPFSNTCFGTPVSFNMMVKPTPVINSINSQTLCANYPTSPIIFTGLAIPNTIFNWTNSFTDIGLGSSGTGNIPSFTATSSYNIPVTSIITVTAFTNGCWSDPISLNITVNPIPTVNSISNQIVCANDRINTIDFTGSIMVGTVYQWTNNNTAIGLSTNGTGDINAFTATNLSNLPINSLITVTPISNACSGVPSSMIVTVKPAPVVFPVPDQVYCGGIPTTPVFFTGSSVTNTQYNWVQSNAGIGLAALSGNNSIPSFTTSNASNIPVQSLVEVTPFSNGCTGPSFSFNYVINPALSVLTVNDIIACGDQTIPAINFSGSIVPGTEYRWTNNNTGIGLPASGIGNITAFSASNNFSIPISAQITVTPFSNNCSGMPISFTITIKPTPFITSINNQTLCANNITLPITFNGSAINGTQYLWTTSNNTIGIGTFSGIGNIPAFTATTLSNIPVTARFTVTPTSNACSGLPVNFDITVNPIPTVNSILDIVQCGLISTQPIVFNGSPVPGTVYQWTNNNVGIGIPANGTGTIQSFTAINPANQAISALIQVIPFSNNCSGSAKQFNITIKPVPKVDSIVNQTLCAGLSTNSVLFSGSAIAGTLYNWSASNGLTGIPTLTGTGSIPTFTTVNTTNITVSNLITVTPFSNGCSGASVTFNYTVHPIPNVQPVADLITCGSRQLGPIPFNGSSVAGTEYHWTNINSSIGIPASGIGSIAPFTPMNVSTVPIASVVTVTPISNSCVGSSISFSVVIKPVPVMTSILPQIICNRNSTAPIQFISSLANTNFTWTNSNPAVGLPFTTGIGNIPSFTGTNTSVLPASTLFTIQPEVAGCLGIAQSVTITINPTPVLSSSILPSGICNGTTFSYTSVSATPGTNFIWQRNANPSINGNTSSGGFTPLIIETLNSSNSQPLSVNYIISLSANGCSNAQSITVLISPAATLSGPPPPATVCSGSIFSYTTQSLTSGAVITWTRNQVPGISNPANTGVSIISEILQNTTLAAIPVIYEVTLNTNGCAQSQTITTVVLPLPAIPNQSLTTCSGVSFQFTPTNTVNNTLLTWSAPTYITGGISGGQANSIPSISLSQSLNSTNAQIAIASYSVQTRSNNCLGNAFSLTVQILPRPVFNNVTLTPVCSGSTITYLPTGSAADTRFNWSLPDQRPKNSLSGATTGSNQVQFIQTLTALNTIQDTAIYELQPISNNCTGVPFSVSVIIKPVALMADVVDTICSGSRFTYLPNNIPAGTTFTWEIPQIVPLGSVTGTQAQIIPAVEFSQLPVNLTQQMATLRYNVYATSDNCVSQPFQVQLVVTRPIPILPLQTRVTCSGVRVNMTPNNMPSGITYSWETPLRGMNSFITGMSRSSINLPIIEQLLFNRNALDSIDYTIYPHRDNCIGNPFTVRVNIVPQPTVEISSVGEVCKNIPDTISLFFTGSGPWQFRYEDNGIQGGRTGVTANPFNLILPPNDAGPNPRIIKFFGLRDSVCSNLTDTPVIVKRIKPLPTGRIISLNGNYVCNGRLDTMFVVSPDSIVGWQWYKNGIIQVGHTKDSISSNEPGFYQVVITNAAGCSDTAIAPHRLIASRPPVIKFRNDYRCINTPIRFFNQTDSLVTGPITWNWDFGNGQTATTYHAQTTYQVAGTYHVIISAKQQNCDAFPQVILDSIIQIVSPIERVDLPSISAYKNVNKPIAGRSLPGYKYVWSPSIGLRRTDSASTIFNYGINVKYGINMTSPEGCVTTDSLLVRVFNDKLVEIFVPKSFTPNGDGVNDKIYAYTSGITEFRYFKIINRFGKQVFETRNIDQGWDGMFNGSLQPMSIFFWLAEGIAEDGTVVQRSGQFLLMR
jgi:gliding motility-associated-like protein